MRKGSTMRRKYGTSVLVALLLSVLGGGTARADFWLGGGLHYLRTLGDITNDNEFDLNQNSISALASGKGGIWILAVEGQVEYVFDYVGTGEAMWEPSLWVLTRGLLYGGCGVGIGYTDGDWQSNPFYALRLGVDVPVGGLELDINASYRFQSSQDLEHLTGEDLDSLTLAAILRFRLK